MRKFTCQFFVLLIFFVGVADVSAQVTMDGGDGSSWNNAYEVSTAEQLNLSRNVPYRDEGKYIKITADIDLTGWDWNPIGITGTRFGAKVDGQNHKISNLKIEKPTDDYVGLFGNTYGSTAELKNIIIEGGSVIGDSLVAALVGRGNVAIDNCHVIGVSVTGTKSVGAIAGVLESNASLTNSTASSLTVAGNLKVGGLVGANMNKSISGCLAKGITVIGDSIVGGIAGSFETTSENSILGNAVIGNILGRKDIGGIVGYVHNNNSSRNTLIRDNYVFGNITGNSENSLAVGGLVGRIERTGSPTSIISKNFTKANVSGKENVGGLVGWAHDQLRLRLNVLAAGSIYGTTTCQSKLIGYQYSSNAYIINNLVYDGLNYSGTTQSSISDIQGTDKSLVELQTQSTYTEMTAENEAIWDFNTTGVWQMNTGNDGLAILKIAYVDPGSTVTSAVWIGGTTGSKNSWNTANNWYPTRIPSAAIDVVIPGGIPNFPVLAAAGICKNITFASGAELGRQDLLTVAGDATVNLTVSGKNNRWQMLSMPIATTGDDFTFNSAPYSWLLKFTPTGSVAGWTDRRHNEPLAIGEGFAVSIGEFENSTLKECADEKVTVIGGLLSGADLTNGTTFSKSMSFGTENSTSYFALVGNPFMTSIDFDKLYANNGDLIKNNYLVWAFDPDTKKEGFVGYVGDIGDSFGVIITGSDNYSSTTDNCIAPLQAFFVEADEAVDDNELRFDLAADAGSNIQSIVASGKGTLRSAASGDYGKLDIIAENGTVPVKALILNKEGMKSARKLKNGCGNIPDIYTLSPDNAEAYGAQFVNTDKAVTIPLAIATGKEGNMKLTFSGMSSFEGMTVQLIDNALQETVTLTDATSAYEFEYTSAKDGAGNTIANETRFYIAFSPSGTTGAEDASVNETLSVYVKNNTIHALSTTADPIREIAVYDMQGRLVYIADNLNVPGYAANMPHVSAEVYVVKVITASTAKSVKVANKID